MSSDTAILAVDDDVSKLVLSFGHLGVLLDSVKVIDFRVVQIRCTKELSDSNSSFSCLFLNYFSHIVAHQENHHERG